MNPTFCPAITPNTRSEALARLRSEIFDVLILGGGINGAGTARDLSLRAKIAGRPLRVALVEQKQFGSGTSSRNSHLIHGGLRYLKQFAIPLVRESLHERAVLLRIAPHLVEPLPFLLPVAGFWREVQFNLGLSLYDFLGTGFPRHRRLSLEQVRHLEPDLAVPGMTAAAEYYDARVRSGRLVLENIFEAVANGAACVNYVHAGAHRRDEAGLWVVPLHDTISNQMFETRARALIDATGPWAHDPAPRLVRGSHIVLPRLNASDHAVAYFEPSGRIIFFIPWGERGDRTLVGTTDVDHQGSPDEVRISEEEMHYLRSMAAKVFPQSAKFEPVASFSSLRPLLASSASPTRASREHRIFFDSDGVLRITGGKFTTYRLMSEEASDMITPELREVHPTADRPLNGNTKEAIDELMSKAQALGTRYSIETGDVEMLIREYGVLTPAVLEYMPADRGGLSRIDSARLIFAVRHEMAQHPSDFLSVSTELEYEGRGNILTPEVWFAAK